ncbi:unnamed protein product [marine sediment metagenome]|uniref:N-acetyltransferase domain-containing protein n=1 Tax=marine sediment metagenome TaxID=412755 RepID=X1HFV9_9ZZZZ
MELHHPEEKELLSNVLKGKNHKVLWNYIRDSVFFNESKGLLPWSWIFREITPELISSLIKEERVFISKKDGRIISLIILLPHRYEKETVEICLIEGINKKEIENLFDFAQYYVVSNNINKLVFFPPSLRVEKIALKAGFSFPYSFKKVLIYELVPG